MKVRRRIFPIFVALVSCSVLIFISIQTEACDGDFDGLPSLVGI